MRRELRAAVTALLAAALLAAAPAARAATAVRIEGNDTISARRLLETAAAELAGLEEPGRRPAAAADAAFQMEYAGRRAGYAFIEVEYEIRGAGAGAVVVFLVREGPRVLLGEVVFSGNEQFTAEKLRPYVAEEGSAPYVEADVRSARQALVQFYREAGFADVKIAEPQVALRADRSVADVRFEIAEGTRFVISGVVFEGDGLPTPDRALEKLVAGLPGQPLHGRRGQALANAVTGAFAAQGYPDAAVVVREEQGTRPGDVVLRVAATSGPRVRIGRVDVAGNERTRAGFIRSRLRVRPGEWFNEAAMLEGFRNLYRAGIFSRLDHSFEGAGDERVLRVTVEEAPAREAAVEFGWGAYELVRGRVSYRDRNVFGSGRSAGAEAGASTKSRFVKADVLDPGVFGSGFSLGIPLSWRFREEPTFTEEEREFALRLFRPLPGRVTVGLKYGFRFNGLSSLSPDVTPDARDSRYTTASVRADVDVDRRNDVFYPSRGWHTGLAVEVADRRIGGSLDFLRCTAGAKRFQDLGAGFVLGLRLDSGFVVPTRGGADLPVSERFFAGGDSSVRSFDEQQLGPKGPAGDPLGGLASTVAGVEVRRRVFGNLAASAFAELGNVAPNRSLAGADPAETSTADLVDSTWKDYLRDFRSGVGLGFQYLTPLGPARLDLAWNPAPRAAEREAGFAWHFSVGMSF